MDFAHGAAIRVGVEERPAPHRNVVRHVGVLQLRLVHRMLQLKNAVDESLERLGISSVPPDVLFGLVEDLETLRVGHDLELERVCEEGVVA